MTGKAGEADFFISRAAADKGFASWLSQLIRAQGGTTILQDEDFGHESFVAQMHDALAGGARVIALLTPDYLKSEYCMKETNVTLAGDPNNRKRRLVPLRLRPCAPSGMLNDIIYEDLLPELRMGDATLLAEKILRALGIAKVSLASVPPLPSELTVGAPPRVHPRIKPNPNFTGREDLLASLNTLLLGGIDASFSGTPKPAALLNAAGPSSVTHSVSTTQTLGVWEASENRSWPANMRGATKALMPASGGSKRKRGTARSTAWSNLACASIPASARKEIGSEPSA